MKKILSLFLSALSITAFSQNVGIGTPPLANNKLAVVSVAATSNNSTIYATNNGGLGNAILGESANVGTYGIRGLSYNGGKGVQGYTTSGTAVIASTVSGIGISAQSVTGYGLNVSGKLKISGGDTDPSTGGLLISDAAGNAKWQRSATMFHANSAVNAIGETSTKVEFNNEAFDTKNSFVDYAGAPTASSSIFTAPVAGVYHFSAKLLFEKTGVTQGDMYMLNGSISLITNGDVITSNTSPSITHQNSNSGFSNYVYLFIDADVHLSAGDKVWVAAKNEQNGDHTPAPVPLHTASFNGSFNGELVFAD